METLNTNALIHPLPTTAMLWSYKLNAYSGFIEAEASVAEARKALAARIAADPYALIGALTPAEPSCSSLGDFAKRVIGMK